MKRFLFLLLVLPLFFMSGAARAQVASGPSIALPPSEVIFNMCKEMGIEVVDGEYVFSKRAEFINRTGKVFVIDARPARTYDDGFIPTAFNMYDAKFKLIYPEFEKLNIAKDAEIFLGIGRPCPMSLNDIKQLKTKGYTNLKAFVKGPEFFQKSFSEVTSKGARKHISNGAVAVSLSDDTDLSKFFSANMAKDKIIVLVGSADNARVNYAMAEKVYNAGYKSTAVLNGRIEDNK
jgi:rhodanese-related sulfurtransferase